MKYTHPFLYRYFVDEHGRRVYADPKVYQNISALLGLPKSRRILPLVKVVKQGEPVFIPLFVADRTRKIHGHYQLSLENGEQLCGKIKRNSIELPCDLPLGYHQLTLSGHSAQCRLIVTPKTAFQPAELQQKQKLWGAILQLYTLRSEQNWGIGDFGDLQQFLTKIAEKGGDFVGLNPIHSLFPANPAGASPYSPSSRLWQNIIYIDVNQVDAFQQSDAAQQWFHSAEVQQQLQAARVSDYVDYEQVMRLKLTGLRFAYQQFNQQPQSEFERFIADNGETLKIQGTFDALHQWLSEQFSEQWGWNCWFAEYQDYRTACVAKFQTEQADLVRFYMWLQFIAEQQLKACNDTAQQLNMPIGFYRDLAVGVADNGAETWADKDLYVLGASVGAPPDIMAPQGQNWGLSPMHPEVLQARGYQPFIDLLRANMKHCGALRIDHILGFVRMWWVAKGESAKNGAYVQYPLEDLLSILALESQRHRCLIIAEALGTVPKGMLESLAAKGILAYNIFYFEYDQHGSKPLAHYPYSAMTTLSTHDLPTVKGYWQGYDFELGQKFGVYPNEKVLEILKRTRRHNKADIRRAVEQSGQPLEADSDNVSQTFNHQLQSYVAATNSALFGTQPEDWLNMLEPVNIPGTSTEYPNWRRKLSKTTADIFADPAIQTLLAEIEQKRKG
ncbi:4-alpha-glucanotransferase [Muribacter muris]|uniref:4-alpha-glucanotransferase n=1 Tax=Muribacter muris TaxID=67855 RepID=A0A4Y9K2Q3_9PAST|nr:4-alpha-glucanotransferase [Muribacter muris]MBF0784833.1 4-alpha-glucanotransferase [Muribacter muris]MBF0826609.1 4-alpha-glucanotransferase [Muribacter muris]TFV11067.1 4-alpha-glucanotransferase [Muribacter muris]